MANLFTYFDNGTFEGTYPEESVRDGNYLSGPVVATVKETSEIAATGTKSWKVVVASNYESIAPGLAQPDIIRVKLLINQAQFGNRAIPQEIFDDIPEGFIYGGPTDNFWNLKAKVRSPSSAEINLGSNVEVAIGQLQQISGLDRPSVFGLDYQPYEELDPVATFFGATAKAAYITIADTWIDIEYDGPLLFDKNYPDQAYIDILIMGAKFNNLGPPDGLGGLKNNGVLYIDDVSLESSVPVVVEDCGLTLPTSEVTVQPSTIDSNLEGNGVITVNVTKPGSTLEYELLGGQFSRSYQSSNVFSNLVGNLNYAVNVRVDGSCIYTIPSIDIDKVTQPSPAPIIQSVTALPNRHQRNVVCDFKEYKPVWTAGEKYSSMVNSEIPIVGVIDVIDILKMDLLNFDGDVVASNIATFEAYDDDGEGNGRIAWTIAQFPQLRDGFYRAVIYEQVNNQLYLVSNEHEVISNARRIEYETAYIEYTHSNRIYNFGYDQIPNFLNRCRIHLNALDYTYPFNSEEYEEVTTGLSKNPRFDVDAAVEIETELYDEKAHRAFAVLLAHNSKKINKKDYVVSGGARYQQDRDKNSPLWNGSIVLKRQEFSTINKQ